MIVWYSLDKSLHPQRLHSYNLYTLYYNITTGTYLIYPIFYIINSLTQASVDLHMISVGASMAQVY